ncbi:unnamed protein product [Cylicocyclus nassatus]|uniref:Uncharacterized protein n=1 Tax=Cylicocyclus nassatus TaxID=53992 RepID=A0AA36MHP9_CYLNA|nr:unnamed protein product [Cylicocyclus nassatus]
MDLGIAQWNDSRGDRPHSHQPKVELARCLSSSILLQWLRSPPPSSEDTIQSQAGKESLSQYCKKKFVVYEEDPTYDYDRLLKGLRACGECASVTSEKNLERISKTTRELLERRRFLRQDPNATHLERLIANASCRTALQEDLRKYRQAKILEAAEVRRSLKKCRRDLCEYHVPLAALLNEDGTPTSSRYKMGSIVKNYYTNLFRSSTPVPMPVVPTGDVPPRILPAEVRTTIQTMKTSTAPGPDHLSVEFLRAGGQRLHEILASHLTSYLQKERIPNQWKEW